MTSAAHDRRLVLVRHASAEAGMGLDDHDRRLTESGRRDAGALGRWLVDQGLAVDLVLCSTAARTRETWAVAASHGASAASVEFRRRVYAGGLIGVLETLAEDAGELDTILVVGHAPTMPILASVLTDGAGSAGAQARLSAGFPTAGLAVLGYAGSWSDLGPGTATLEDFVVGRG